MKNNSARDAKERFTQIEQIVKGEETAEGFLWDVLMSADKYVSRVVNMGAQIQKANITSLDRGEYQEVVKEMDEARRMSHESLISNLHCCNRYLFNKFGDEIPVGGVYSLPPESIRDRSAIGDWAGYLVEAMADRE